MKNLIKDSEIKTSSKGVLYCRTDYSSSSVIAKRETRDCVVRSFASGLGIDYDTAHKFVADEFGRKNRQGTRGVFFFLDKMVKRNIELFGKKLSKIGMYRTEYESNAGGLGMGGMIRIQVRKGVVKRRALTVGRFLAAYPTGTFLLLVRGHMFTIIDGVVYGNYADSVQLRTRIECAVKVN